jgi:hypothetical protein
LDWSNHKIICKSFNHSRPTPQHHGILLFPGSNAPPRFEWLQAFPNSSLGLHGSGEYLDSTSIFGRRETEINSSVYNGVQGRIIRRKREEKLFYFKLPCDNPDIPAPTVPNLGLRAFTRAGACNEEMKGPVLFTRIAEFESLQYSHRDMDMRDAREAADWLSQCGRERDPQSNTEVLGTAIESAGRVINHGYQQWSNVLVNGNDVAWTSEASQIANLLGLPLQFRSSSYDKTVIPDPKLQNSAITLLHRDVISQKVLPFSGIRAYGPKDQLTYYNDHNYQARSERLAFVGTRGFGSSMVKYGGYMPDTCYVVRADGKPLPREHTEAICSYIADKVEPRLKAAIEGLHEGELVPSRNEILNSITKSSFLEYYEAMKEEKVKRCNMGWRGLPNPYDIKHTDLEGLKKHTPRAPFFVPSQATRIGPIPSAYVPNTEPTYFIA